MELSLNLMGRAPVFGQVKTRLIPLLGVEGATRAHERLFTHVARMACAWTSCASERHFRLWCSPDKDHPFFDTLVAMEHRWVQPEGGLGAKMAGIFQEELSRMEAVLLMGADGVSVTGLLLDQALEALHMADAVMAPTEDGGYLLLGLKKFHPELFQGMAWGGDGVAEATRGCMRRLGLHWHELPVLWDVDRPEDWVRFVETSDRQP